MVIDEDMQKLLIAIAFIIVIIWVILFWSGVISINV